MTVRTRQSYMDLCRSDRPWKGRDMADLVDKIYDVEEKADRASKTNATKLVQAKADGFDVAGEGFLQKRGGKWILSEPDFLTEEEANKIYAKIRHSHNEYALRRHAPTHHYDGADPLEGQKIAELRTIDRPTWASVRLDPEAPVPSTRRTGEMFWDTDNHCPSFVMEGSDTIWQGPMEDLLYGQNDSGVPHLNGMVGYIKGSQGQRPTIDISRADDRIKSLSVVFATETSIAANNSGYYTPRGLVRDAQTDDMAQGDRMWLQPTGGRGSAKPPPGLNTRNVSLGHVIRSHPTNGSIFVDITAYPFVDELSGVGISGLKDGHQLAFNGYYWQNQPSRLHRWPIKSDLSYEFTLSYSAAIRRPILTPTGSVFYCWMNGERLTFTGTQSLPQHPNVTGQYFYYVDSDGTFQYGTSGFDLFTMVPICIVEWDATKVDGWCRPELHTTEISALLHQREHDVDGAEIAMRSGFSISGYTYDLDTVAGVTFGVSGGILWDEDARSVIAALSDGSSYSMFYKSGASGAWTWDEGMTLPYKQGTTYPTVNAFTGGTWTQTEIDGAGAAVFFNVFVVVAPCVNKTQIVLIQGQGSFASQALAEAQTWDTMDLSGLTWKESVSIYQVIYKSQAAWSATTKKTRMALAKKITKGSGSVGVGASNEHNALTGRDALDCHPSLSITDIYALSVGNILKRVSLGVAAAVPNTDYLPVNNPNFTGTLSKDGSILLDANRNGFFGPDHRFNAGAGNQTNLIFRDTTNYWTSFYTTSVEAGFRDYNNDGTANSYPIYWTLKTGGLIRISRIANMMLGIQVAGTTTIDSSRNAFFNQVTATNLAGVNTRPTVATAAGLIQAQDASTFRTTIDAAARLHAPTHHWNGSDPLAGQSIAQLRTTSSPTFKEITITDFAVFRRYFGSSVLSGLYPLGVTPSATNYVMAFGDNGASTYLNGGTNVFLSVNDVSKVEVTSSDVGIKSGVSLSFNSIQTIDSSRNAFFNQVTATNLAGVNTRPTVATAAGLIQAQDASTFRTTIDAAARLHAPSHHWNGEDPLTGQSISGLMTTDTPTFYGVELGDGGVGFSGASGIALNGFGEIVIRPPSGIVRMNISDTEISCSNAFSAASGRFSNLSTGFVRSNGIGQLSSSALLASELPNHATRHHWDGADPLTGQSINGLRTSDSPRFYNITVDGELKLPSYFIYNYDGKLSFDDYLHSTLAYIDGTGFYENQGVFPLENGLECGRDTLRWNFRSNDTNHEVEIVNATEGGAGTNIASIPATGNYFRLSAPTSGQYKNYRVPDNTSWIGKELVLTCTSTDPNGFIRVYAPNSGELFVGGASVSYIDFVWGRKVVLHSDGVRWYV